MTKNIKEDGFISLGGEYWFDEKNAPEAYKFVIEQLGSINGELITEEGKKKLLDMVADIRTAELNRDVNRVKKAIEIAQEEVKRVLSGLEPKN